MDVSSIALQGIAQANSQLEAGASAIAAGDPSDGAGVDVVSLSAEMVALMSAQVHLEANIAALKTTDQMQVRLMDVMV